MRRKQWARYVILLLSVLHLINVPFGTLIGGYSIWVLVNQDAVALFSDD